MGTIMGAKFLFAYPNFLKITTAKTLFKHVECPRNREKISVELEFNCFKSQ